MRKENKAEMTTAQEKQLEILKSGRWVKSSVKGIKKVPMKKLIEQRLVETTDLDGVTLYRLNLEIPRANKIVIPKVKDVTNKIVIPKVKDVADADAEISTIVKNKYKKRYQQNKNRCGDELSEVLSGATIGENKKIDLDKLIEIGKDNGVDVNERWGHLNNGMIRMNLGNFLRNCIKKGVSIHIAGMVLGD